MFKIFIFAINSARKVIYRNKKRSVLFKIFINSAWSCPVSFILYLQSIQQGNSNLAELLFEFSFRLSFKIALDLVRFLYFISTINSARKVIYRTKKSSEVSYFFGFSFRLC